MFIETHKYNDDLLLTFIKSANVQVYPSGRRRSSVINFDSDGNGAVSESEKYRIPFDPESRLNTEANNRKHSGLNGFTQTYLVSDWSTTADTAATLTLALKGYLFTVKLGDFITANSFGSGIMGALSANLNSRLNAETDETKKATIRDLIDELSLQTKIYANILLEDTHLFSGFQKYYTEVLRNQSTVGTGTDNLPESFLDQLKTEIVNNPNSTLEDLKKVDSYYFSGLSFSTTPLTNINYIPEVEGSTDHSAETYSEEPNSYDVDSTTYNQRLVSLCILKKNADGKWEINEEARLPKIEHGDTTDSIVITGKATLKSDLEVKGKADIDGSITSKSNILAVGNSETAGNILADHNIRAKNDITADRFLNVKDNAKILKNLTVGPEAEGDGEGDPGTITAKRHVETPTLNASTSITTPVLNVQSGNPDEPAQAYIDEATISDAEIRNKIKTKDLESTGAILANIIGTDESKVENIIAKEASIDTLTAGTLNANDIQQKINGTYTDVPVIFVQPQKSSSTNKTEYQLQIRRVNVLAEQQID